MALMEEKEVIRRFCRLATHVMDKVFLFSKPADCFCDQQDPRVVARFQTRYEFDDEIFKFIESAVEEKLKRGRCM